MHGFDKGWLFFLPPERKPGYVGDEHQPDNHQCKEWKSGFEQGDNRSVESLAGDKEIDAKRRC